MNTIHTVYDLLQSTGTESAFAVALPTTLFKGQHFPTIFKNWCESAAPLTHTSIEVESLLLPDVAYESLIGKVSFPRQAFLIKNCPGEIVERWVSEIEANTSTNPGNEEIIFCEMALETGVEWSQAQFDATVEIDISEHPRLFETT